VLSVLRLESGVPCHVTQAKQHGASRAGVISALLFGLLPAGHGLIARPAAMRNGAGSGLSTVR
jgi:hypothetical protein